MRPRRRGVAMAVIGGVMLLVLAPAAAVIGILIGIKGGLDNITHAPVVQPGQSRQVAADQEVMLFAYVGPTTGGDGVSDSVGTYHPSPHTCTVTGSGGNTIHLTTTSSNLQISRNGARFRAAGHFTAPKDDDYTITCGNHPAMVLDADVANHLVRNLILPIAVGIGAAIVLALIGIALLIIGIVRITRSNRRIREFDQQTVPAGPYPPQGPYPPAGPQPPYGPKS